MVGITRDVSRSRVQTFVDAIVAQLESARDVVAGDR